MSIILNGDGRTNPLDFDPKVLEAFKSISDKFSQIYDDFLSETDEE